MSKIVLFSINDFSKTSGGSIRMYGVINALAENNHQVIFISNASDYTDFHPSIQHIPLNYKMDSYSKRKFQFFLSILPLALMNFYYRKLGRRLKKVTKDYRKENILFFEYLDNSMGYWLKKNKLIKGYINDIHGIAAEEFKFQKSQTTLKREKFKLKLKANIAKRLDKKVFDSAYKIIFPTQAMQEYWANLFPSVHAKENIILPNVLQNQSYYQKAQDEFVEQKRRELNFHEKDRVILFAGGFKKSSGILDLIQAFANIQDRQKDTKLLLVGDGPLMKSAVELVKKLEVQDKVKFTGFTDYNHLRSYQEIARILVCPDQDNIFSHLIVHFKYLDALLANKVVINGNFRSVVEINPNEELSLGFEPSSIADLTRVLHLALDDYERFQKKYAHTRDFILEHMTYQYQTQSLKNLICEKTS